MNNLFRLITNIVSQNNSLHFSKLIFILVFCQFGTNCKVFAQNTPDLEFQMEHTKFVSSIAISPDRRYAATGSFDRTIKIWDIRSKKLIKTFRGHNWNVSAVCFSNDGKYLFSGESGVLHGPIYSIKKWDFLKGELADSTDIKVKGMVKNITVSPEGKYLLIELGSYFWKTYEVRDAETGEVNETISKALKSFSGANAFRSLLRPKSRPGKLSNSRTSKGDIIWGKDDNTIAYYDDDRVMVWRFDGGAEPIKKIIKPKYKVASFNFGPDSTILTGGFKGELDLWQANNEKKAKKPDLSLDGHQHTVSSIDYDQITAKIISRSLDGVLRVWDENGNLSNHFKDGNSITIFQEFTEGSPYVLTAGTDASVWDRTKGVLNSTENGSSPISKLMPLYFHGDSLMMIYTHENKRPIQFLSVDSLKAPDSLKVKKNKPRKTKRKNKAKGKRYKIKTKIKKKKNKSLIIPKGQKKLKIKIGKYHLFNQTIPFVLHPQGESIATIGKEGIHIWNFNTGKLQTTIPNQKKLIVKYSYSADGNEIVGFDLAGNMTSWRIESGEVMKTTPLVKAPNWITKINIGFDSGQIITGDRTGKINIWNLQDGKRINAYVGHKKGITGLVLNKKKKLLASADSTGTVKIWQGITGQEYNATLEKKHRYPVKGLTFHRDSAYVISSDKNEIVAWDLDESEKPLWRLRTLLPIEAIDLDPGKELITGVTDRGLFHIWKLKYGKFWPQKYFWNKKIGSKGKIGDINNIRVPVLGNITKRMTKGVSEVFLVPYQGRSLLDLILNRRKDALTSIQYDGNKYLDFLLNRRKAYFAENNSALINGKFAFSERGVSKYHIKRADATRNFFYLDFRGHHTDEITSMDMSSDKKFLVSGSKDSEIKLWHTDSLKDVRTFKGHIAPITVVKFSDDDQYIYSADEDNRIKIWNKEDTVELATIVTKDTLVLDTTIVKKGTLLPDSTIASKNTSLLDSTIVSNYIIYTPDHYYLSVKNSANDIHFILNDSIVASFEQFDLKYNRPDIVLERLGMASDTLIQAYHKAYQKRLEKMGVSEENLISDFHAPTLHILNINDLPQISTSSSLSFQLAASDSLYHLRQLNVYVNDVSIYGRKGLLLDTLKNEWKGEIEIPLNAGKNKVQFSVLNQAGTTSLFETHHVSYNADIKGKLYLIAMGISKYADASMNLEYPAKDAQDIVDSFRQHYEKEETIPTTLFNEEVTVSKIRELKTTLQQTTIHDKVIVFIASHGLVDENLNYYIATHDVNFSNPSQRGMPYEELESLLDSIPARQKLMLIDACFSGEIDKETVELDENANTEDGKVKFRVFDNRRIPKRVGLDNSFELMKEMFVDLRRGTGTTIISAASGVEFALEGKKWDNGVFTYAVLKGLEDGAVSISELQKYVASKVYHLTNGNQQPNFRRQNISNDWRVW